MQLIWQMLLPGWLRCCSHQGGCGVGRWNSKVSFYSNLSSDMLCRTSSHMCGRWYLPMFLFRDGLLTLIYRASFIVLRRFWPSLPTISKLSIVTLWPEMTEWSWMGEGVLRCSLNLSAKFLADSPMYSSSQSTLLHLYLYMTPFFFRIVSLSFGDMRRFLMVSPPFKCTWTLPQIGRSQVWTWQKLVLLSIIYSVFEKIKLSRLFQTEWEAFTVRVFTLHSGVGKWLTLGPWVNLPASWVLWGHNKV